MSVLRNSSHLVARATLIQINKGTNYLQVMVSLITGYEKVRDEGVGVVGGAC